MLERTATRFRPTVAVVDLDAVRHNVRALKPDRAAFMAVVKANGYGHGAVPVARAALQAGATWLGVALVEEGIRLRDGGVDAPVLVLTEFPPGSEGDALAARMTPTVYSVASARRIARTARDLDLAAPAVHVKVDTGMHRVGAQLEDLPGVLRAVDDLGLKLGGVWTHLAKSEELDDPFTSEQLGRFERAAEAVRAGGLAPPLLHAANSGATIADPRSHFDLVRVGIAMYGLCPGEQLRGRVDLRPALSWKSAVAMVKRVSRGDALSYGQRYRLERDATIATVPVGYADGFSRLLSNRADVLIGGRRRPVSGAVTMDQIMVDCGEDTVQAGDEVVLIGRQGEEEITADEAAGLMGTISYEVVCGVSERVPREYAGERR